MRTCLYDCDIGNEPETWFMAQHHLNRAAHECMYALSGGSYDRSSKICINPAI